MVKIGIVSDIHFGVRTYFKTEELTAHLQDPIADRDVELVNCLYQATATFAEQKVSYIFVAGDIFHGNQPAQKYQDLFWKWVQDTKVQIPDAYILIIPGNHDAINTSRELNAFSANKRVIDSMERVSIIDQIKVSEIFPEFNLLFVPHVNKNKYEYPAKLKTLKDMEKEYNKQLNDEITREINSIKDTTKPLILFGHGYLKGTKQGYEVNSEMFYSVIDKNASVNYYIVGHVHKYQSTADSLVPGSAIYTDFGEIVDIKKHCVVTLDQGAFKHTTHEYNNRKLIICELEYKDGEFIAPPANIFKDRIVRLIVKVATPADKAVVRQEQLRINEMFKDAYLLESTAIEVKDKSIVKSNDDLTYKNMNDSALLTIFLQEKRTDEALIKECVAVFQEKIEPVVGEGIE